MVNYLLPSSLLQPIRGGGCRGRGWGFCPFNSDVQQSESLTTAELEELLLSPHFCSGRSGGSKEGEGHGHQGDWGSAVVHELGMPLML